MIKTVKLEDAVGLKLAPASHLPSTILTGKMAGMCNQVARKTYNEIVILWSGIHFSVADILRMGPGKGRVWD
jgi:hypothetical protein